MIATSSCLLQQPWMFEASPMSASLLRQLDCLQMTRRNWTVGPLTGVKRKCELCFRDGCRTDLKRKFN
jgi:hypothetical protein